MPRKFRNNSSDKQFLEFQQTKDFLQSKTVPLNWVKVLSRWNKQILSYNKINHEIFIIQGKEDITIDWKYNIKFLKEKIQNSQIKFLDKANHQLINESEEIKKETFKIIMEYLND